MTGNTAFGGQPLPDGVTCLELALAVGKLTALHAPAHETPRGTILVIPGFTGAKEDYVDLLALLSEEGWDCWAYSQRGQADSAAPAGVDAYLLADFAGDAIEVARLVGEGEPVHVLGHSFGGLVARAATIESPDTFLSLTMLCSGPRGWGNLLPDPRPVIAAGGALALWARDNPDLAQVPADDLSATDARIRLRAARTSDENLHSAAGILRTAADTTAELRATGVPVHIIHGEFDDVWPIEWQRDNAIELGATYSVIDGGGHCPQEDLPRPTAAQLLPFWSRSLVS